MRKSKRITEATLAWVETSRKTASVAMGQRLRQFRIAAGLSQTEVALRLGVHQQSYQRYESGTTMVPSDRLTALSEIFNVPMDTLSPAQGRKDRNRTLEPLSPQEVELLTIYRHLTDDRTRSSLLDIVRRLPQQATRS